MDVAFGDHQVANVTADNIARTLGIPIYQPTLPDGADDVPASDRFWDLSPIRKFPHTGSALYYWYSGTLPPPQREHHPDDGAALRGGVLWCAAEVRIDRARIPTRTRAVSPR